MFHIEGKIEGVAPILFNRMTEAEMDKLEKKATGGNKNPTDAMAEALQKLHMNGHGIECSKEAFKMCLLEGCWRAGLKFGRSGLSDFLKATVYVDGDLLFGKKEPDYIDKRIARTKTDQAIVVHRPALSPGWKLPFNLLVTDDRRNPEQIKIALEEAGMLVGLGSFRPDFGRFRVVEWRVVKPKAK
jgi:hypothetical protein